MQIIATIRDAKIALKTGTEFQQFLDNLLFVSETGPYSRRIYMRDPDPIIKLELVPDDRIETGEQPSEASQTIAALEAEREEFLNRALDAEARVQSLTAMLPAAPAKEGE